MGLSGPDMRFLSLAVLAGNIPGVVPHFFLILSRCHLDDLLEVAVKVREIVVTAFVTHLYDVVVAVDQ